MTPRRHIPQPLIDRFGLTPSSFETNIPVRLGVDLYQTGNFVFSPVDYWGDEPRNPGMIFLFDIEKGESRAVAIQFLEKADRAAIQNLIGIPA